MNRRQGGFRPRARSGQHGQKGGGEAEGMSVSPRHAAYSPPNFARKPAKTEMPGVE